MDDGKNLSVGQRQLVCFCRAILRKNKIVILDEATANIDVVTEQRIQQLIQDEFADATMITIAHRLNTILKSDKILLLDQGEVKEYESPQKLIDDPKSAFSRLLYDLKRTDCDDDKRTSASHKWMIIYENNVKL